MDIKTNIVDGALHVVLSGSVLESAKDELDELRDLIDGKDVRLHCGGLTYINSIGTGAWMKFMANVNSDKFVFQNCSFAFVEHLNIIPGMVGKGRVESVQVPYRCQACERDSTVVVRVEDALGGGLQSVAPTCQKCNRSLKPEVVFEEYFYFAQPS